MPDTPSWNFDLVFEFSKAFDEDVYHDHEELLTQVEVGELEEKCEASTSLGDFTRIYKALGISPPTIVITLSYGAGYNRC